MRPGVEILVDCENRELYFPPLNRRIRGRYDFSKIPGPGAAEVASEYPFGLPGMILELSPDGSDAYLREPLYDPQHAATREKIEKRWKLEPEVQEFENIDLCTWVRHIKMAIKAGLCRIIKGELPKVKGKPILSLVLPNPPQSDLAELKDAIREQTAVMTQLLERLTDK